MTERRAFSFALIFRHSSPLLRAKFRPASAKAIAEAVRANPADWQCLLMKRSYRGREWDTFGGAADPGETPLATLLRELKEESGLEPADILSVGRSLRPYAGGALYGYGFVVVPQGSDWDSDDFKTIANDEVERTAYFSIEDIHDGEPFLRSLAARLKAFLLSDEDADCWDYLTESGKHRCRLAGEGADESPDFTLRSIMPTGR